MKLSELKLLGYRKVQKISKVLKIPKSTVSDTIQRYKQNKTVVSLPKTGRPSQFDDNAYRKLENIVRKNPRNTATQIRQSFEKATGIKAPKIGLHSRMACI